MEFIGYVNGIDVIASHGAATRCLAFINTELTQSEYIQIQTTNHQLQTILETASSTKSRVAVSYEELGGAKDLLRVRLLDR